MRRGDSARQGRKQDAFLCTPQTTTLDTNDEKVSAQIGCFNLRRLLKFHFVMMELNILYFLPSQGLPQFSTAVLLFQFERRRAFKKGILATLGIEFNRISFGDLIYFSICLFLTSDRLRIEVSRI